MKLHLFSFLTSAMDRVNGQLQNQAVLPMGKEIPAPTQQKGGWALELVWVLWRIYKSLGPARNRTVIAWMSSPLSLVTTPTELPSLSDRKEMHPANSRVTL